MSSSLASSCSSLNLVVKGRSPDNSRYELTGSIFLIQRWFLNHLCSASLRLISGHREAKAINIPHVEETFVARRVSFSDSSLDNNEALLHRCHNFSDERRDVIDSLCNRDDNVFQLNYNQGQLPEEPWRFLPSRHPYSRAKHSSSAD
jgi:hypothetical protein